MVFPKIKRAGHSVCESGWITHVSTAEVELERESRAEWAKQLAEKIVCLCLKQRHPEKNCLDGNSKMPCQNCLIKAELLRQAQIDEGRVNERDR